MELHRANVRDDIEIAYWREGVGGSPLLLVHGWPETKRIWSRNIEPLARAGFEVVVPDLRGYGDSSLASDGFYDLPAFARDLHALMTGLGHDSCVAAGGDAGGAAVQDLGMRFEGFVTRQVLFNTVVPLRAEATGDPLPVDRAAADYFIRQGTDADGLLAELDTPEKRVRYVAGFYGHRFWAAPGAFGEDDVAFMAEPFADADKLRASIGMYEGAMGKRELSEIPLLSETSPIPTLALHGPADHCIWSDFPERCEAAFTELVGPFVVPRAGHFLQWERADLLNQAIRYFAGDGIG
jgi:pimeloyl-ACP methyl ester carboxylesterase